MGSFPKHFAYLIWVFVVFSSAGLANAASALSVQDICTQSTRDDHVSSVGPYQLSMAPTSEERRAGIHAQEEQIVETMKVLSVPKKGTLPIPGDNAHTTIKQLFNERAASTPLYPPGIEASIRALIPNPSDQPWEEVRLLRQLGPLTCGVFGHANCKRAFSQIIDWMQPVTARDQIHNSGWISRPDLIVKLGSDPRYSRGSSLLARRLISKFEQAEAREFGAPGDLFQDTVSAFQDSGLVGDGIDAAWDYLALYSTRGADMIYRFVTPENLQVFASLGVVASIISYLDAIPSPSGKVYSLPASIHTTCDYTRAYHFWMSASLSRKLAQNGVQTADAFDAVHAHGVDWEEYKSDFLDTKEVHAHFNEETRKNMIFGDAGAAWGLQQFTGQYRAINLDSNFMKSYLAATPNTSIAASSLELLLGIVGSRTNDAQLSPDVRGKLSSIAAFSAVVQPDADLPAIRGVLPR